MTIWLEISRAHLRTVSLQIWTRESDLNVWKNYCAPYKKKKVPTLRHRFRVFKESSCIRAFFPYVFACTYRRVERACAFCAAAAAAAAAAGDLLLLRGPAAAEWTTWRRSVKSRRAARSAESERAKNKNLLRERRLAATATAARIK